MAETFHWLSILLVSSQKKGNWHLKDAKTALLWSKPVFSNTFVRSKIISSSSNILNQRDEMAWASDCSKCKLQYLSTALKMLLRVLATTQSSLRCNTLIKDPLLWRASASRASLMAHSCLYDEDSISFLAFRLLKTCRSKISQNSCWSMWI